MSQRPKPPPADTCTAQQHGTATAFDWWGCRCPEGREAYRLYRKRQRENRQPPAHVPGVGTARRLQALAALGYPWVALAPRLHVSPTRVRQLADVVDGVVHRDTAAKVSAVFTELAATPGPSKYARTVAARNGWVPPLAWDDIDDPAAEPCLGGEGADLVDEVVVERVLNGEHVALNDAELIATLQAGVARGEPLSSLSLRLGINYQGAKTLLGGELTPRRAKRAARASLAS